MSDPKPPFSPPVLLDEAHDAADFDSGEPSLDQWLRERALHNLNVRASRTYVVCPAGKVAIAGYYALSMGQILAQEVPGSMRRNTPNKIPAVILGRLAIDRAHQGQGLGRTLLADAVARALRASAEVSARLVLVHAISGAAEAFYLRHGFARLPVETPTLALDLLKYQKLRQG